MVLSGGTRLHQDGVALPSFLILLFRLSSNQSVLKRSGAPGEADTVQSMASLAEAHVLRTAARKVTMPTAPVLPPQPMSRA